jgi:glycosyltransferase involved in cell wall biosynthesis
MNSPNFALYYAEDGYSTDKKIMGRQSAGKSLLRGIALKWPNGEIHGFSPQRGTGQPMLAQLQRDGFSGSLSWSQTPGDAKLQALGNVYVPAPPSQTQAHARNRLGPSAYSLFGVTHTLSSSGAMDLISDLIRAPFQPWDGLICTSQAALNAVRHLQTGAQEYWARTMGATRFNEMGSAVIPLGINVADFRQDETARAAARGRLSLTENEVVFLFAGRLAFHAKANPTAFYQAVEAACRRTGQRLVCLEAGIYPNQAMAAAYQQARRLLAPSARFIGIDGSDHVAYQNSWAAADVFVSLADNIQETFGITPLEAMAANLPVIVSDWDGYKDTVRDGEDGFRIPTLMPLAGAGDDLAFRHAHDLDTYDYYIGRVSMATAIDLQVLTDRLVVLATDRDRRRSMGEAGHARATAHYDWSVILDHYVQFAEELTARRRSASGSVVPQPWPARPDPFELFAHYPTQQVAEHWAIRVDPDRALQIEQLLELNAANFVFEPSVLSRETILELLSYAKTNTTVGQLLKAMPLVPHPIRTRALMWLVKLGVVTVLP